MAFSVYLQHCLYRLVAFVRGEIIPETQLADKGRIAFSRRVSLRTTERSETTASHDMYAQTEQRTLFTCQ